MAWTALNRIESEVGTWEHDRLCHLHPGDALLCGCQKGAIEDLLATVKVHNQPLLVLPLREDGLSVRLKDAAEQVRTYTLGWELRTSRPVLVLDGSELVPLPVGRILLLTALLAERIRQDAIHPFDPTRPDGIGSPGAAAANIAAHEAYERAKEAGTLTWMDTLREEMNEVDDADSLLALLVELLQTGAVTVKWCEALLVRGVTVGEPELASGVAR